MEEESFFATSAKAVDDNIVREVIINLTNTSVMNEILELSKTAQADEIVHQEKEPASKQSTDNCLKNIILMTILWAIMLIFQYI